MAYTLPSDVNERPVAIVGAGTLGSRIACVYAAGGNDVRIFDVSEAQRRAARDFIAERLDDAKQMLDVDPPRTGEVQLLKDLAPALDGAWMVVEAVPEKLELKREVFGELDQLAHEETILASNSSSLPTSQIIADVAHPERVLNTHYYQPPEMNAVELMSCSRTAEGLIEALMDKLPQYGLVPFHVRRESDGFIFNRIWAAIKRECLMVVEEGVATPEDVDGLWKLFTAPGIPPFELMDRVGLDVVLNIEEHYADVRDALPEGPRKLLRDYIDEGRLGLKSGRGFYEHSD